MPDLYSRMDDSNWLTPSIAEILDQGATPPGGDGSIREHMLTIQRELTDLETPAKIINVRSMPSYTLYVARPETIGRIGNRKTVTPNEIRRSLARIAENHNDWMIGFIPKLQEDEGAIGILLRTTAHRPLSLRRLLVRGNFRSATSYHSFTMGITLEQELIVKDLNSVRHLLVVGGDNSKLHFLRSLMLTLILLNTPSELRVIVAGKGADNFKVLMALPHSLGKLITQGDGLHKILDGLSKEAIRRQVSFNELNAKSLDEYNRLARERNKTTLPRVLVLIDSLADIEWEDSRDDLVLITLNLLKISTDLGIHLILTVPDGNRLPEFEPLMPTQIVMRSVGKAYQEQLTDFHPSLMRFIDAFVVDKSNSSVQITPVELCSTANNELISAVTYWQQNRQQRTNEVPVDTPVSGKTGVTDLLTIPEMPIETSQGTISFQAPPISRQTTMLVGPNTSGVATLEPLETEDEMQTSEVQPLESNKVLQQATALSAYLGWLSIGALMDVLSLSEDDADNILEELKRQRILENSNSPTPRFIPPVQG
jgi:hypothetical protein